MKKSLKDLVQKCKRKRKSLLESHIFDILFQILSAISYLDETEMTQGKIRLKNVLIDDKKKIKIAGLGCVFQASEEDQLQNEQTKNKNMQRVGIMMIKLCLASDHELKFNPYESANDRAKKIADALSEIKSKYSEKLLEVIREMVYADGKSAAEFKTHLEQNFPEYFNGVQTSEELKSMYSAESTNKSEIAIQMKNVKQLEKSTCDTESLCNIVEDRMSIKSFKQQETIKAEYEPKPSLITIKNSLPLWMNFENIEDQNLEKKNSSEIAHRQINSLWPETEFTKYSGFETPRCEQVSPSVLDDQADRSEFSRIVNGILALNPEENYMQVEYSKESYQMEEEVEINMEGKFKVNQDKREEESRLGTSGEKLRDKIRENDNANNIVYEVMESLGSQIGLIECKVHLEWVQDEIVMLSPKESKNAKQPEAENLHNMIKEKHMETENLEEMKGEFESKSNLNSKQSKRSICKIGSLSNTPRKGRMQTKYIDVNPRASQGPKNLKRIQNAQDHLRKICTFLRRMIEGNPPEILNNRPNHFKGDKIPNDLKQFFETSHLKILDEKNEEYYKKIKRIWNNAGLKLSEASAYKSYYSLTNFQGEDKIQIQHYMSCRFIVKLGWVVIPKLTKEHLFRKIISEKHVPFMAWILTSTQAEENSYYYLELENQELIWERFKEIDQILETHEIREKLSNEEKYDLEKALKEIQESPMEAALTERKDSIEMNMLLNSQQDYGDNPVEKRMSWDQDSTMDFNQFTQESMDNDNFRNNHFGFLNKF